MERCKNIMADNADSMYHIDTEGFMHFKNRIYVPNHSNLKQIIFTELHDNTYVGHRGYQKFITTKKDFYWPNKKK